MELVGFLKIVFECLKSIVLDNHCAGGGTEVVENERFGWKTGAKHK